MSNHCKSIQLEGVLSFETVNTKLNEVRQLLISESGTRIEIDLSMLQIEDSSALAMVLELQRKAKNLSKELTFKSAPEKILALTRVVGLDSIMKFS